MRIKSQTLFIVILIAMVSNSCKKSTETPLPSGSNIIAKPMIFTNTLVGTWVLKSYKWVPINANYINYQHLLYGNIGQDTSILGQTFFKQYFDSITFKKDSSFYGYYYTYGIHFAMAGQWSVTDSVMTFDNAQIISSDDNSQVGSYSMLYWYFSEKEGKNLALATPVLCEISHDWCEYDIYFEKDQINYIKLRE